MFRVHLSSALTNLVLLFPRFFFNDLRFDSMAGWTDSSASLLLVMPAPPRTCACGSGRRSGRSNMSSCSCTWSRSQSSTAAFGTIFPCSPTRSSASRRSSPPRLRPRSTRQGRALTRMDTALPLGRRGLTRIPLSLWCVRLLHHLTLTAKRLACRYAVSKTIGPRVPLRRSRVSHRRGVGAGRERCS